MSILQALIGNLQALGFYDFILPWLFAFAVTWGAIKMSGLFGNKDSVAGIVSLVVAFFVTNYTPYGYIGKFFTQFFGESVIALATILVALLFLGLIGVKPEDILKPLENIDDKNLKKLAPFLKFGFYALFILLAVFLFTRAAGIHLTFRLPHIYISQDVLAVLFALVIIIVAVVYITKK